LLSEAYRIFDQIAIATVGIAPEPANRGPNYFPQGSGITDRATRMRMRLEELVPLMNVLQQRLA
jgi:hypothetical protein